MASKTRWIIAALVLIAALALSACQPVPTTPPSSPAPVEPPTAQSPTEAPAAEPVVITLAYNRFLQTSFGPGPAPINLIREEVAKKYPNIDVRLNLMPDTINGMREALAVWIAAEDPTVDIYGMDMPWVQEFGRAGWALPLRVLSKQLTAPPAGLEGQSDAVKVKVLPDTVAVHGTPDFFVQKCSVE